MYKTVFDQQCKIALILKNVIIKMENFMDYLFKYIQIKLKDFNFILMVKFK